MKLEKWDPDLRTLRLRYLEGRLDLQPAFQRGLVWPAEKKARLIDTALRSWSIPPIHLIREPGGGLSVLDGQQRLAAFFDFLENKFAIRQFQPMDDNVAPLAGRTFGELSADEQYRIMDTRISTFEIYDYSPEEPYELFFRLNHPTGLTAAEKRNALAGETRAQVRELVEIAESHGWSKELIGFSDGRGAYDDVIARACRYVEWGRLDGRLTMRDMESFYRNPDGISSRTYSTMASSIEILAKAVSASPVNFRFNKATLVTWLLVVARGVLSEFELFRYLPESIAFLERVRLGQKVDQPLHGFGQLVEIYRDRSSLRVADALSVIARDAIAGFTLDSGRGGPSFHPATDDIALFLLRHKDQGVEEFESDFLELASHSRGWSELP